MIDPTQPRDRRSKDAPLLPLESTHWFFFGLSIVAFLFVAMGLAFPQRIPQGVTEGAEEVLIILATASTLFALARQLPVQNVLLATAIIALIGSGVSWIGLKTSLPFGPFFYGGAMQPRIGGLPAVIPLIWVIAVLNSRGVARLVLRPWRKTRTYGWWVIGLTIVLTVILDLGWEVFAGPVSHYVLWNRTKFPFTWNGVPVINFLGWIVTLLLIMAFCTPALINKRHTRSVPDYHSIVIWVLLNLVCLIGAAQSHLWPAVIFTAASCVVASVFAVRGARW